MCIWCNKIVTNACIAIVSTADSRCCLALLLFSNCSFVVLLSIIVAIDIGIPRNLLHSAHARQGRYRRSVLLIAQHLSAPAHTTVVVSSGRHGALTCTRVCPCPTAHEAGCPTAHTSKAGRGSRVWARRSIPRGPSGTVYVWDRPINRVRPRRRRRSWQR